MLNITSYSPGWKNWSPLKCCLLKDFWFWPTTSPIFSQDPLLAVRQHYASGILLLLRNILIAPSLLPLKLFNSDIGGSFFSSSSFNPVFSAFMLIISSKNSSFNFSFYLSIANPLIFPSEHDVIISLFIKIDSHNVFGCSIVWITSPDEISHILRFLSSDDEIN